MSGAWTPKQLDVFFDTLRKGLVPLIRAIGEKPQIDDSFLHLEYPVEQQKAFADYLMEVMGMDRGHCGLGETEHPLYAGVQQQGCPHHHQL